MRSGHRKSKLDVVLRLLKRPMVTAFGTWARLLSAPCAPSSLSRGADDVLHEGGGAGAAAGAGAAGGAGAVGRAGGEGGEGGGGDAVSMRLDTIDDRIESLDNKLTAVMTSIAAIEGALRASPRPVASLPAELEGGGGGIGGRSGRGEGDEGNEENVGAGGASPAASPRDLETFKSLASLVKRRAAGTMAALPLMPARRGDVWASHRPILLDTSHGRGGGGGAGRGGGGCGGGTGGAGDNSSAALLHESEGRIEGRVDAMDKVEGREVRFWSRSPRSQALVESARQLLADRQALKARSPLLQGQVTSPTIQGSRNLGPEAERNGRKLPHGMVLPYGMVPGEHLMSLSAWLHPSPHVPTLSPVPDAASPGFRVANAVSRRPAAPAAATRLRGSDQVIRHSTGLSADVVIVGTNCSGEGPAGGGEGKEDVGLREGQKGQEKKEGEDEKEEGEDV